VCVCGCGCGCHVTVIISLNDIIRFIFVKDLQCVYCEAEYLNIIHVKFMLEMADS
jgi:hypothetical protein